MSLLKYRRINKPGNDVGKLRAELYRSGKARIREALKAEFYLEAIALIESMLADRLEARWAWIHDQKSQARKFSTVGNLAKNLFDTNKEPKEAKVEYEKAHGWAKKRNAALHEMFKLHENEQCVDWQQRYARLKAVTQDGVAIFNSVDGIVKKLNKR